MAQVTPKPPRSGKQKTAPQQPSDLEVLHPEREVKLSVDTVTVREYGNVEWLRLLPQAEPLVANITAMLSAGAPPSYEDVLAIIAHHTDGLLPLVVQSVDRDVDWVETLNSNDLEALLMHWWGVNGHFFVNRAKNRAMAQYQEEMAARNPSAGEKSTPPSSPTATGQAKSADTPPGS